MNKPQAWLPPIPARLEKDLGRFTVAAKGWYRWYKGKTRYVCSKSTPLEEVENRWIELKRRIDSDVIIVADPNDMTLREAASAFFEYIDQRVLTGIPEPMAEITAEDYKRTL